LFRQPSVGTAFHHTCWVSIAHDRGFQFESLNPLPLRVPSTLQSLVRGGSCQCYELHPLFGAFKRDVAGTCCLGSKPVAGKPRKTGIPSLVSRSLKEIKEFPRTPCKRATQGDHCFRRVRRTGRRLTTGVRLGNMQKTGAANDRRDPGPSKASHKGSPASIVAGFRFSYAGTYKGPRAEEASEIADRMVGLIQAIVALLGRKPRRH